MSNRRISRAIEELQIFQRRQVFAITLHLEALRWFFPSLSLLLASLSMYRACLKKKKALGAEGSTGLTM